MYVAKKTGLDNSTVGQTLENVFAGKSTGTLHSRAGPVLGYIKYWKSRSVDPIPFTEAVVYSLLKTREKSAATFCVCIGIQFSLFSRTVQNNVYNLSE